MDKQEFTRRVLLKQDALYRISGGLLREPQDRMDAVQEAVLKAWAGLGRLRCEEFFETWLTRILINECRNIQRRRARVAPPEAAKEPVAPQSDDALRDALRLLDEKYRLPLLLYYMEGYHLHEIAVILKIPKGTVATRLKRARAMLRELLEESE